MLLRVSLHCYFSYFFAFLNTNSMKNWPFTCSKSRDLNAKLMGHNLNNTEMGGGGDGRGRRWEGSQSGAERALAFHQCGPGSNPDVDAICGLSLLLVLSFAPRDFSPGTPVFLFP